MRKSAVLSALVAVGVSGCALFFSPCASATSYTVYVTSPINGGGVLNYGLTGGGSVVLEDQAGYTTFTPPNTFSAPASTAPNLMYDNGVSCTPTGAAGFTVIGPGRCNGALEVFAATTDGNLTAGLFEGDGTNFDLIYQVGHFGFDNLLLNAAGDVAAVVANGAGAGADRNVLVVASTPEPGSLMLLGTGMLAGMGMLRRKRLG